MRLCLSLLALAVASGCPTASTSDFNPPEVPVREDPRGLTTSGEPCNLTTGTVAMHPSLDTLDLDIGAIILWAFREDTVIYNNDFPASGELAFRGFNIHRIGFPQEYQVCMPPGRYVVRAVQDVNHNGFICELDEYWGSVTIDHPVADPEDARILIDKVVSESDGCPPEETGLPTAGD
ncbi:MAG: hypothetical protein KDA24_16575 [Deltaproteobacteria bacterium]|nr:hypothetical protein [Deltaproteobacteria bacterium]